MIRKLARACLCLVAIVLLTAALGVGFIYYQGKRSPVGDPQYVALGSSFAAGIGLGETSPNSPFACMRTIGGHPSLLAQHLDLSLVDMSCSGATTDNVLNGGQYFQGAQLNAVTPGTKLVTITSGGNDVRYVGDLSFAAAQQDTSISGWITRQFLGSSQDLVERDFDKVQRDLVEVVTEIRLRAPDARIVLVTYPTILPPEGTCPALNITAVQADTFRTVGENLAAATRAAAINAGAVLVDLQQLGVDHHACSQDPWVNGWHAASGTPFHPNAAGARAAAAQIESALKSGRGET